MRKVRILCTYLMIFSYILYGDVFQNKFYEIVQEDGTYYLSFFQDAKTVSMLEGFEKPDNFYPVYFKSVDEMCRDIKYGIFTREELRCIKWLGYQDGDSAIELFDLDGTIYFPKMPSDMDMTIVWYSNFYHYRLEGDIGRCSFYQDGKEKTLEYMRSVHSENSAKYKIAYEEERNATIYIEERGSFKQVFIEYEIESGSKYLFVCERYTSTGGKSPYYYGDVGLRKVDVYGIENGKYFDIHFYYLTERPSVEWLSEFGIQEYTGEGIL